MARWNKQGKTIALTEYNCPYIHISQRHPEVCALDQAVISHALSATVERKGCMLTGAEGCEYVITPKKAAESRR